LCVCVCVGGGAPDTNISFLGQAAIWAKASSWVGGGGGVKVVQCVCPFVGVSVGFPRGRGRGWCTCGCLQGKTLSCLVAGSSLNKSQPQAAREWGFGGKGCPGGEGGVVSDIQGLLASAVPAFSTG
jgi:hypothetical protein